MRHGFRICRMVIVWCWCIGMAGSVQGREIVDMTGRTVTVPDTITSIYGTTPPVTYLIYAMAPKLLAGLNSPISDLEKPYLDPHVNDLPVLGGWFGQGRVGNLEAILAAGPDIILRWQWQQPTAADKKLDRVLSSVDIPVVYVVLDDIEDYPRTFRFLGDLFGMTERGEVLSEYADDMLASLKQLRDAVSHAKQVSVYYAEGPTGLYTECHTSIHAQLIPLCGGDNVHKCTQSGIYGMQPVSMEQVLIYNPEVIISHDALFFSRMANDRRWSDIRAVREQRVYQIPDLPFNWFDRPPSFMRLLGMKWLAHTLYPDQCAFDMIEEARAFFSLFLNVDLTETQIQSLL